MARKEAVPLYQAHLENLERHLTDSGDFLAGSAPAHLDFAAYHTLWFKRVVGGQPMPGGLPQVATWYERMSAIGHGSHHVGSVEDAFAAARDNTPRPVPEAMSADPRVGRTISIMPGDYALDATEGVLVGIDDERCILARETEGAGKVHVHLPVAGFEISG
jgi:hypothetical protein